MRTINLKKLKVFNYKNIFLKLHTGFIGKPHLHAPGGGAGVGRIH
jgi:hypothetical protein